MLPHPLEASRDRALWRSEPQISAQRVAQAANAAAERTAGKSRSRAMRVFPESDPRFAEVFGLRQDSESTSSDTKNRLWNRRCRTMGHNSVELNAISYQVHTLVTALLAYHNRAGADLTAWFGQHDLPRKRRHLAVAV